MGIFEFDIIIILRNFGPMSRDEINENLEMRQIFLSEKRLTRQLDECIAKSQIKICLDSGNYSVY